MKLEEDEDEAANLSQYAVRFKTFCRLPGDIADHRVAQVLRSGQVPPRIRYFESQAHKRKMYFVCERR